MPARPTFGLVQSQAMAGGKLWVGGVELAEPASPRRRPSDRGRRPPIADPGHPALLPAFESGPTVQRPATTVDSTAGAGAGAMSAGCAPVR